MATATNIPVTNFGTMMPMLTNNGPVMAWLLPRHGLHALDKLLPFQRAFRQCVEHVQAMDSLYEERPDRFGIQINLTLVLSIQNFSVGPANHLLNTKNKATCLQKKEKAPVPIG